MKIQLYHGTSSANADKIIKDGFAKGKDNWDGIRKSIRGHVYMTTAYSVFYATNAVKDGDELASIIKVEVDENDIYPDEDYLIFKYGLVSGKRLVLPHKYLGKESLEKLGTCSIRLNSEIKILGRKDFKWKEMFAYSDPSIHPMNYAILGAYYRELSRRIYDGESLEGLLITNYLK